MESFRDTQKFICISLSYLFIFDYIVLTFFVYLFSIGDATSIVWDGASQLDGDLMMGHISECFLLMFLREFKHFCSSQDRLTWPSSILSQNSLTRTL